MSEPSGPRIGGENGFDVTRVFDAPRERLWQEWTEPERFADWFGGAEAEIPIESVAMDVRVGGTWRATMKFGGGEIQWKGEYQEVVEPERLVVTMSDQPDDERFELITVQLRDLGDGRTEMVMSQHGQMTDAQYKRAGSGWGGFFDRLDERLAS
jgi:uncharacterized protein YndB with AHSA1/START domain